MSMYCKYFNNLSSGTSWPVQKNVVQIKSDPPGGGGGGGRFSHWHDIGICACLLGCFFANFGLAIGGFLSQTKAPNLHKLGVFWAIYGKKHPIWAKYWMFFAKKICIFMGGKRRQK